MQLVSARGAAPRSTRRPRRRTTRAQPCRPAVAAASRARSSWPTMPSRARGICVAESLALVPQSFTKPAKHCALDHRAVSPCREPQASVQCRVQRVQARANGRQGGVPRNGIRLKVDSNTSRLPKAHLMGHGESRCRYALPSIGPFGPPYPTVRVFGN